MRRELKVKTILKKHGGSWNHKAYHKAYPDEKGTEREALAREYREAEA